MLFKNRLEAAARLAEALAEYAGHKPLVLAIPRGAVPMARLIADRLEGDLDVVLVRKLGAPGNPEFALGAVDEEGRIYVDPASGGCRFPDDFIRRVAEREVAVLRQRRARYGHPPLGRLDGRTVIVVDDGIATGATAATALRSVRDRGPGRLILAAAVASRDAVRKLRSEADELVVLLIPEEFFAVGEFFEDFSAVSDEEAVELLHRAPAKKSPPP